MDPFDHIEVMLRHFASFIAIRYVFAEMREHASDIFARQDCAAASAASTFRPA